MKPNGEFHFHKGHYLSNDVIKSLRSVENENYDELQFEDEYAVDTVYTDADVFLHGSCNLFALTLHETFGYEVYEIRDKEDRMVHVFCKSTYRGQDVYVDVRGVTTDFVECVSEFRNQLYRGYHITTRDIEEDKLLDNEGDKTGYPFAQAIVKKYHDYYDTTF